MTDHGGATWLLVLGDDGAALVSASDLVAEPMASIDLLVPTAIGTVSGLGSRCHLDDATALRRRATVLVSSELVGSGAGMTAEQSTEYAKDREQFGTPIGAIQAVKHRCVDMAVRADAATSLARLAPLAVARRGAHGRRRFPGPRGTRIVAGDAAIDNAQVNVQNHGGIGFTWEHTAHRYVTRAQVRARCVGDERSHLGELLAQPSPS